MGPAGGDSRSPYAAEAEADNRRLMREFADRLRRVSTEPVIDPGLLRVPGWTGPAYGWFFLEVLGRFCRSVHFMDGWQYSRGASKEFVRACELGLDMFDARGEKIRRSDSLGLLGQVVAELAAHGIDEPRFTQRISALSEVP